jgi:predicted ATPase
MITRIKAERYRCLQSIDQTIGPFQILVGPNGSGKSAFLEVVVFLATLVSEGLENAITTENFSELVWQREGSGFTICIEAELPEPSRVPMGDNVSRSISYEVEMQTDPTSDSVIIANETVSIGTGSPEMRVDVVRRRPKSVLFKDERGDGEYSFDLPRNLSSLANLPSDESKFPGAIWLKNLLREGVQFVILDNELLRGASPPYQGKPKVFDGFTLPRFVARLMEAFPELFKDWMAHVRTALPDLDTVYTVVRPEDKYRYIMLRYRDGVELPSWAASDGTLRLLALTILAYLTDFKGIYLTPIRR